MRTSLGPLRVGCDKQRARAVDSFAGQVRHLVRPTQSETPAGSSTVSPAVAERSAGTSRSRSSKSGCAWALPRRAERMRVARGPDVLGSSRQGERRAFEAIGQFCPDARKAFLIGRAQAGALDDPAGDADERCRQRTSGRDGATDRTICEVMWER